MASHRPELFARHSRCPCIDVRLPAKVNGMRRSPLRMLKRYLLAVTFGAALTPAHAGGVFAPLGPDCGQWLTARQARQSSVYEGYVVGMLIGMSMGSGISIWGSPQSPVHQNQVFFWLDEYCRTNPLGNTMIALVVFANQVTDNA